MMRASTYFTNDQVSAIETAIVDAETKTSGEIVVAVARRSGQYDRGEDLFGVVLALVAVATTWLVFQRFSVDTAGWSPTANPALGLLPILGIFVAGFAIGAALASKVPVLGTLLSSRREMEARVKAEASVAFHMLAVRRTAGASGVLIYVSLLERMVWVVGDDAVSAKVDQAVWDAARTTIVDGFKAGTAADALVKAIAELGDVLGKELPADRENPNELHNRLRFLD